MPATGFIGRETGRGKKYWILEKRAHTRGRSSFEKANVPLVGTS